MDWFIEFWNSDALWVFYKNVVSAVPTIIIMALAGGISFKFGKAKGKKAKDDESIEQLKETIEQLKNSQRSQMRDIITRLWQTCMKRKKRYITPEDKDLLKSCYREYLNLKGNTYIEHLYQDLMELPEYSPQNLQLPKKAQEWREEHNELEEQNTQ